MLKMGVMQSGCFGTGIISPRSINNVFFIEWNKLYKIPIFYLNLKVFYPTLQQFYNSSSENEVNLSKLVDLLASD